MPLFSLSNDITYANYNHLESYGFPLMFTPQNKHIYFGTPNSNNTCYTFSCAELSLKDNTNTYKGDLNINSGQGTRKFVSGISVNDHKITCSYNTITLPIVTNGLIYSKLNNTLGHYNEIQSGSVSALGDVTYLTSRNQIYNYEIEYDNNGHITGKYANKVFMPKSQITLSATENTYTSISSGTSQSPTYIQFTEKSDNTYEVTSTLTLTSNGLITSYGTNSNNISLNVDENIFTTYEVASAICYLECSSVNVCSQSTGSFTSYYLQCSYDNTYWHRYKPTSITTLDNTPIFRFTLTDGSIKNLKLKLLFYNLNNKPIAIKFPGTSSTTPITPSGNTYEYSYDGNISSNFTINMTCSGMTNNSYILLQLLNINGVEINNTKYALSHRLTISSEISVGAKYVISPGVKCVSSHGDSFNLLTYTDTSVTTSQCENNSIAFAYNSNLKNTVYAYSIHSKKSTNTTFSYIPKQIEYDEFGHITALAKTNAGIKNIVTTTQSQYNSLSTKDPYTLYLITS